MTPKTDTLTSTRSTAMAGLHLEATPFVCSPMRIEPQWIDYNGHLNMAYYNVLFDRSIDEFFGMLGVGQTYFKTCNKSTMTAECHVRYLREIRESDEVRVHVVLIAADENRMHTFEELRHATEGWVSATSENMTLHIDMEVRRVAPFPANIASRIQAVAQAQAAISRPEGLGRRVTMPLR